MLPPALRKKIKSIFYKLLGNNYWNTRYMLGGNSGYNSELEKNNYANYVWSLIEKCAGKQTDVLDVGCGDLVFWKDRDCEKYTGIDVSSDIIKKNKKLRPNWKFIVSSASAKLDVSAETVICMNTLYHIMNDDDYNKIINNLTTWSKKWLMIITWHKRPVNLNPDDYYQKYRDFSIYKERILRSGFGLELEEHLPFDDYGCLWIFKKLA
jgi:SAM-dependent methyltransferase